MFKSQVDLKELDVEVREILEEDDENTIKKEMGADAIRHVKNDAGEIQETWVMWRQVDDLSLSAENDRVYKVDKDEGKVIFGDGVHGKIPPAGTDNIRAIFGCGKEDEEE
jgi:hypothetical protein